MLPLSMEQQIERIEKLSPWLARHADKIQWPKINFQLFRGGFDIFHAMSFVLVCFDSNSPRHFRPEKVFVRPVDI